MNLARRAAQVTALLIIGLAGCGSPTKQDELQAKQDALLKEAMALQQCESTKGYSSPDCAARRSTYESHLAAFKATYGR